MQLTTSQADLSSALQLVSQAVSGRPTHPVLANVLLAADAATGRLSLTGFDLSLGIQASIPAAVQASGDLIRLSLSQKNYCLSYFNGNTTIWHDGDQLAIVNGCDLKSLGQTWVTFA